MNKIKSESNIIEKNIDSLKEVYAVNDQIEETDTVMETQDQELDEIMASVDLIIDQHLKETILIIM